MIRIESLHKSYGARHRVVDALGDVSIELGPGVWGVVGPNGAGKTTLLGLVLGFIRPSGGSITVDGIPPHRYVRRHGAGYLPERFRLPPEWPVRQALTGFARLEGLAPSESRTAIEQWLDRLGLRDHADRAFGTLSRGLAQRVGLAQALLGERRLVVLDEPGEGLDPLWRVRLRDLLADVAPDRTILLASHDLAEVERVAGSVVVLDGGRVRGLLDVATRDPGPTRYRLVVSAATDSVAAAFPGASKVEVPAGTPRAAGPAGTREGHEPTTWTVVVDDPRELSHRLAALLGAGATVHAVSPESGDLEARVRERLEEDG